MTDASPAGPARATFSAEYRPRAVRLPEPTPSGAASFCFVHGMGETFEAWTGLARRLAPEYSSFLLDLPWSGQAGYDWTIDSRPIGDWIGAALGELPTDPVVLVAHSYGAMAALDYLDRHGTARVTAAVLVSPFYLDRPQRLDWPLFNHYAGMFPRFLEDAIALRSRNRNPDPEVTKAAAEFVRQKIGPLGCLEFVRLYSRMPTLKLNRLTLPVLILVGGRDVFTVRSESEALAAALPRARLEVLPSCGHFSITEDSATVASEITDFFQRFCSSSTPRIIANE